MPKVGLAGAVAPGIQGWELAGEPQLQESVIGRGRPAPKLQAPLGPGINEAEHRLDHAAAVIAAMQLIGWSLDAFEPGSVHGRTPVWACLS